MPLAPDVEKELIRIVREAAKTEIMTRFRVMPDSAVHAKSAPDDLVTDADMHAEVHITHAVRSILPDALVIGEDRLLNPELRYPDEFVRHKMLDLTGDLSILGAPLRAHVVAYRAGHDLHGRLARKIWETKDGWYLAPGSERQEESGPGATR